jgi:trk system potassium uptake protein TrkH
LTAAGSRTLRFAARPRLVAHYLGQMMIATAALGAVPAAVCFATGATRVGVRFAVVLAALALLGALGARLQVQDDPQRNEALAVSALTFLLPPLLFAWPLAGYGLAWDDALFEAISGITTTGLSMLDHLEAQPAGLLFARAWLQWIGGLGVVVLVLALLTQTGAAASFLGFGRLEARDVAGGTRAHARRAASIYLGVTAAGVVCVWALTGTPFDALLHVLAAVSTGGFSSHDASLGALPGAAVAALLVLGLAGAVPFYSYYTPAISSWRTVSSDAQLKALLAACLCVAGLLYLLMPAAAGSGLARAGHALVLAVSAQTTTGFATLPPSALDPASQLVLILSMFTGGALGSTAGGLKILRVLVLMRLVQLLLQRMMTPPSAVRELRVGGVRIEGEELESIAAVIGCYLAAVVLSWLVFLAYGRAPLASLFEIVSATATVGLTSGLTSTLLEPVLKGVLCVDMLFGRVEAVALLVLLMPGTWFGRKRGTT